MTLIEADRQAIIDFDYTEHSYYKPNTYEYVQERRAMPDVTYSNLKGESVRFEIELNAKSKDRYRKKIEGLLEAHDANTIYIANDSRIENVIREIIIEKINLLKKWNKKIQSRVHVYCEKDLVLSMYLADAIDRLLGRGLLLRKPHYGPPDKNFALFELDGSSIGCGHAHKIDGPSGVADHSLPS